MADHFARFGHHADPARDFCFEVEVLEVMAFGRRTGLDPAHELEDRIRAALEFESGPDWESNLARRALRELEAEFLRHDVMARRRALAREDRIKHEFEEAGWWG